MYSLNEVFVDQLRVNRFYHVNIGLNCYYYFFMLHLNELQIAIMSTGVWMDGQGTQIMSKLTVQ